MIYEPIALWVLRTAQDKRAECAAASAATTTCWYCYNAVPTGLMISYRNLLQVCTSRSKSHSRREWFCFVSNISVLGAGNNCKNVKIAS